jgi:hypothetical protein
MLPKRQCHTGVRIVLIFTGREFHVLMIQVASKFGVGV